MRSTLYPHSWIKNTTEELSHHPTHNCYKRWLGINMVVCPRPHLLIKMSSFIWYARLTFLTHSTILTTQAGKCLLIHFFFPLIWRHWLELMLRLPWTANILSCFWETGHVGFGFLPHTLCHSPRKCVNIHNWQTNFGIYKILAHVWFILSSPLQIGAVKNKLCNYIMLLQLWVSFITLRDCS